MKTKPRKRSQAKSSKAMAERSLDPSFLKDTVTREAMDKIAFGVKSDESVNTLQRAGRDVDQKVGWAKAKQEDARSQEERDFYQARAHSGTSTSDRSRLFLPEHLQGAAQSNRAKHPRRSVLRALIDDFLVTNPKATEKHVLRFLLGHPQGVIDVTDDDIKWTDKNGRTKTTPLTGIKDMMSRSKKS
jgi:hypothetical protein